MDINWYLVGAGLCGAAVLVLLTYDPGPTQAEQEQDTYCDMVEIFQETDGEYGWPDFRGTYDKHC